MASYATKRNRLGRAKARARAGSKKKEDEAAKAKADAEKKAAPKKKVTPVPAPVPPTTGAKGKQALGVASGLTSSYGVPGGQVGPRKPRFYEEVGADPGALGKQATGLGMNTPTPAAPETLGPRPKGGHALRQWLAKQKRLQGGASPPVMKKGGSVKKSGYAHGGKVRGVGIAKRGHGRGRNV